MKLPNYIVINLNAALIRFLSGWGGVGGGSPY